MQINLTGFLNARNAREFIGELWGLLASAMENSSGIPTRFLDKKKEEIKKRQVILCTLQIFSDVKHPSAEVFFNSQVFKAQCLKISCFLQFLE